jgi:hypothetical protein
LKNKTTYKKFVFLAILIFLVAESASLFAQDNNPTNPYTVKSAYLVNICKYTSWENQELRNNTTFKIYTIGQKFENGEIKIPKGVLINNRTIEVVNVKTLDEINDFNKIDVLFIYSVSNEDLLEILKVVSDKNILTVSDKVGYGELGVIINFFIEDSRVNFELNREAELKSKIKLKSMLYKLKGNKIIDNNQTRKL